MFKLKVFALALLIASGARASTHQWREGHVVELSSTRAQMEGREVMIPAVVIKETDGNRSYLILVQAYSGPKQTHVVFHVGDTVQFQRVGENSAINGFLEIRYMDAKGREKSELHMIANVAGN